MNCPNCGGRKTEVRYGDAGTYNTTIRKRRCPACRHTWRTVELTLPVLASFMALKGSEQNFKLEKNHGRKSKEIQRSQSSESTLLPKLAD